MSLLLQHPVLADERGGAGFVGESKCGSPTCHGAPLPAAPHAEPSWKPWKSARSQWLSANIDRHSRAFATLETDESKRIAGYMGVQATRSDKCLSCHAPKATAAAASRHREKDGVSCEHCHGAAEYWLEPHVEKDWPSKKKQYVGRGFYDNGDFLLRAKKCASCHVDIDHEIVAGGHPPLQFEMVAYAQVMKHWDDQDERPPGAFTVDPILWSIGQLVGLQRTVEMIERRAGSEGDAALGMFQHFKGRECYQCHHKLVEDAQRQAQGHYEMVDIITTIVLPERHDNLARLWRELVAAIPTGAKSARRAAKKLGSAVSASAMTLAERGVDRDATRKMLARITASGQRLKSIRKFAYRRPETSNAVRIEEIGLPWWYTTGAPEQVILALQALCSPALDKKCDSIDGDLRKLVTAVDRFNYQPDAFAASLGAINRKLFP